MSRFIVKLNPHQRSPYNITIIMFILALALMPTVVLSVYKFGYRMALIYIISMTTAVIGEWVYEKLEGKKATLMDLIEGRGSITGLFFALTMPPTAPLYLFVLGSFISIVIGKMIFGGFGANIFNPALVGRVVLLVGMTTPMSTFAIPQSNIISNGLFNFTDIDTLTVATPLTSAMTLQPGEMLPTLMSSEWLNLFLGNYAGSIGEVSSVAILIGGVILLATRVITWHIPVIYIATVFFTSGAIWFFNIGEVLDPVTQLLTGGLLFGAIFMATDYVTSPLYYKGRIIFGIGCGVLTVLIRIYGSYPEGVAFAILIMNAVTPIIDKYTKPKPFGVV